MKPTYEEFEAEVLELRRLLKIALDRVSVLEERLNKNSKNSSKSPSSDQKSNTSAEEKKSKKSRTGVARVLYPPERVDKEVLCTRTCCAYCQSRNLQSIPGEYFVWQQAELPEMQAEITQFSCEKYRCRDCHTRSTADLPKGVPFSAFGPKLMALTAMPTGRFHLAKREAIELIKDLYDVDIAEGSVINIEGNIATAIMKEYSNLS